MNSQSLQNTSPSTPAAPTLPRLAQTELCTCTDLALKSRNWSAKLMESSEALRSNQNRALERSGTQTDVRLLQQQQRETFKWYPLGTANNKGLFQADTWATLRRLHGHPMALYSSPLHLTERSCSGTPGLRKFLQGMAHSASSRRPICSE